MVLVGVLKVYTLVHTSYLQLAVPNKPSWSEMTCYLSESKTTFKSNT
jgi:hypothetical protein